MALDSQNAEAHTRLAEALLKLGKSEEARVHAAEAERLKKLAKQR